MSDKTTSEETTDTINETAPLDPPTPPETEDAMSERERKRQQKADEAKMRDAMVNMAVEQVDSAILHMTKALPAIMAAKQYAKAGFAGRMLANLTDLSHDLHCVIGYDFNPEAESGDDDDEVWF